MSPMSIANASPLARRQRGLSLVEMMIALAIGVVMFFLELIYLFGTDLTLDDDDLPEITRRISSTSGGCRRRASRMSRV